MNKDEKLMTECFEEHVPPFMKNQISGLEQAVSEAAKVAGGVCRGEQGTSRGGRAK